MITMATSRYALASFESESLKKPMAATLFPDTRAFAASWFEDEKMMVCGCDVDDYVDHCDEDYDDYDENYDIDNVDKPQFQALERRRTSC